MRALKAIIALLFVLAGIALGALNQQTISIDLFFVRYQAHLGLALLLCVLAGAVIGGALASLSLLTDKASVPKAARTTAESDKSA
ncbi:MAG: lipopolysaccharide assembly protein LapA domain-containing protein [Arenimonas sp.]